MTEAPQQLVLDLAHRVAMGRDDFLVSRSNGAAVDMIDSWPNWPQRSLAIVGPAGSGKTHLVEVWRARAGGTRISAGDLSEASVTAAVEAGALAVEDIDRGVADERILFHLLNLARELKLSLLITSRSAAGELRIALPDLNSRLRALGFVRIEAPDSALLSALLVKLFDDRQLKIEPRIVGHLAQHMERSAEMATRVVDAIDQRALQLRKKVTVKLANDVLASLGAAGETSLSGAEIGEGAGKESGDD